MWENEDFILFWEKNQLVLEMLQKNMKRSTDVSTNVIFE